MADEGRAESGPARRGAVGHSLAPEDGVPRPRGEVAADGFLARRRGVHAERACEAARSLRARRGRAAGRRAFDGYGGSRRTPLAPREPRDLAAGLPRRRGSRDRDAERMMRILWVKIGGLWPPDRGGRLRSYHLISELARRHRVNVLTTHAPGDVPDSQETLPGCERVISVPH